MLILQVRQKFMLIITVLCSNLCQGGFGNVQQYKADNYKLTIENNRRSNEYCFYTDLVSDAQQKILP